MISGETINSAHFTFNGTGDAVHAQGTLRLPAGAANAVVTHFPKEQRYEAEVHSRTAFDSSSCKAGEMLVTCRSRVYSI